MAIAALLAQAAGPLINTAGGFIQKNQDNKQTDRWRREDKQWRDEEDARNKKWAEDMWNKSNEYNSMANQMARLKEAGVNPHLAYMQPGSMQSGQPQQSTGAYSSGGGSPSSINAMSGSLFDPQTMLLDAQRKNIEADTAQKEANTEGQLTINGINNKQLQSFDENFINEQNLKKIEYAAKTKGIQLTGEQITNTLADTQNKLTSDKKLNQEITNLVTVNKLNTAEISKVIQAVSLMKVQAENTRMDTSLKQSSRSNIEAQAHGQNILNKWLDSEKEQNYIKLKELAKQAVNDTYMSDTDVDMYKINKAIDAVDKAGGALQSWINPFKALKPKESVTESGRETIHRDKNGTVIGSHQTSGYRRSKR